MGSVGRGEGPRPQRKLTGSSDLNVGEDVVLLEKEACRQLSSKAQEHRKRERTSARTIISVSTKFATFPSSSRPGKRDEVSHVLYLCARTEKNSPRRWYLKPARSRLLLEITTNSTGTISNPFADSGLASSIIAATAGSSTGSDGVGGLRVEAKAAGEGLTARGRWSVEIWTQPCMTGRMKE